MLRFLKQVCFGCFTLYFTAWLMWIALPGCHEQDSAQKAQPTETGPNAAAVTSAAAPRFADGEQVVLVDGSYDTLGAAGHGLEAALRLPAFLPLPYPRVERHGDRFRVVLGRGTFAALKSLHQALSAAGHPVEVQKVGQGGGDDVMRLGIVCTEGDSVPLYATPLSEPLKEVARLHSGQVLVLKEDEDEPRVGSRSDDDEGGSEEAERGFLTVLQPQAGLVHGPDVLLPADCTPRDEDNDDGNGRILGGGSGPGDFGKLCLTTRFSGRVAHLARADVVAVTANYRRCLHFPGAGTFDGFDHTRSGNFFAVEVEGVGLRLYAVAAQGALQPRGQWAGLSRPAFLGDDLVAVSEDAATLSLWVLGGVARRDVADTTPLPAPRSIANLAVGQVPALPDKTTIHRPGAPTLGNGRVRVSFLRGCRPEWAKRVKAAAGSSYVQCVLEIETEVGLGGERLERHCRLDNAENPLNESLTIPCP